MVTFTDMEITQDVFRSVNIRVHAPEGPMNIVVLENEQGAPIMVQTFIGKAGSTVAAWSGALDALISMALRKGVTLESVMNELRDITSDRTARVALNDRPARSGPEAYWKALMLYRKGKFDELRATLGKEANFSGAARMGV